MFGRHHYNNPDIRTSVLLIEELIGGAESASCHFDVRRAELDLHSTSGAAFSDAFTSQSVEQVVERFKAHKGAEFEPFLREQLVDGEALAYLVRAQRVNALDSVLGIQKLKRRDEFFKIIARIWAETQDYRFSVEIALSLEIAALKRGDRFQSVTLVESVHADQNRYHRAGYTAYEEMGRSVRRQYELRNVKLVAVENRSVSGFGRAADGSSGVTLTFAGTALLIHSTSQLMQGAKSFEFAVPIARQLPIHMKGVISAPGETIIMSRKYGIRRKIAWDEMLPSDYSRRSHELLPIDKRRAIRQLYLIRRFRPNPINRFGADLMKLLVSYILGPYFVTCPLYVPVSAREARFEKQMQNLKLLYKDMPDPNHAANCAALFKEMHHHDQGFTVAPDGTVVFHANPKMRIRFGGDPIDPEEELLNGHPNRMAEAQGPGFRFFGNAGQAQQAGFIGANQAAHFNALAEAVADQEEFGRILPPEFAFADDHQFAIPEERPAPSFLIAHLEPEGFTFGDK